MQHADNHAPHLLGLLQIAVESYPVTIVVGDLVAKVQVSGDMVKRRVVDGKVLLGGIISASYGFSLSLAVGAIVAAV